jgi:hypothetical protein
MSEKLTLKLLISAITAVIPIAIVNPALAIQIRFVELVNTQTVMPDDDRPFTAFDSASISGSSVVFRGTSGQRSLGQLGQPTEGTYREGIYLLRDRTLTKIIDLKTPTPGFPFQKFASPILSGNNVAFLAISPARTMSLYTQFDRKPLTAIISPDTPSANNNPYFWKFGTTARSRFTPPPIHMDGTSIVFEGPYGPYNYRNGELREGFIGGKSPRISSNRIITILPGLPSIGPSLVPTESGSIQLAIDTDPATTIIDGTTRLPHGALVRDLGYLKTNRISPPSIPPVISANTLFFFANDTNGQAGLYTRDDRRIREILRQGTVIPDLGPVEQFGPIAISGINQAFAIRQNDITIAIALRTGGQILKVVKLGDPIDGKILASLQPLGTQFLSGRTLVFIARFTDGTRSIYRAEAFPENVAEAEAMARDREPDS